MAEQACGSLAEWQTIFNRDVLTLHQLMLLRTRKDDEDSRRKMQPWFQAISDAVTELDETVLNLRRYAMEEQAELSQLQTFQEALAHEKKRVAMMKAQMPEEAIVSLGWGASNEPAKQESTKENVSASANDTEKRENADAVVKKSSHREEVKAAKPQNTRVKTRKGISRVSKTKAAPKDDSISDTPVPVIATVSQSDLDSAPQYVKGRLTVEKIDKVVDSLNNIAKAKYDLLSRPFRELESREMTQWQDLRDNECEEAAGKQFLTDAEIKGFGNFRLDATAKSVINILRHVGALKEVRGPNKTRIFIIN